MKMHISGSLLDREMGLVSKAMTSGIHVNQTAEDRGNPSLLLSK